MDKKRILIVNKFLYPRGGDCIVALNEAELLRKAGHIVELWGMDYPQNLPDLSLADTFASEVKFGGHASEKLRATQRIFGLGDIRKSFKAVLERFRPDTVFFHNIHSYLSPVIVGLAKEHGARTLWTQHDYKIACPAYNASDPSGRVCTECISHPRSVIAKRCMKGSLLQSVAAYAEARYWNPARLAEMTDAFICPSETMARKIIESGIPAEKAIIVPNFVTPERQRDLDELAATSIRQKNKIVAAGRLVPTKGTVKMLSELTALTGAFTIHVFGSGPEEDEIKKMASADPRIKFGGWIETETLAREISSASLTICPSEFLENGNTVVIDSVMAGTPVIVTDCGALPDMLQPGWGLTYDSFTPGALSQAVNTALTAEWDHSTIAAQARERYSAESHLSILSTLL